MTSIRSAPARGYYCSNRKMKCELIAGEGLGLVMLGFSGRASCGPQTHTRAYAVVTMTPKRTQSIVDSFSSINARPRVLEDRILLQRTCHTYHMQMPCASSAFHGGVPLYTPNSNSRLGMRNAFCTHALECGQVWATRLPEYSGTSGYHHQQPLGLFVCRANFKVDHISHLLCVCALERERGVQYHNTPGFDSHATGEECGDGADNT